MKAIGFKINLGLKPGIKFSFVIISMKKFIKIVILTHHSLSSSWVIVAAHIYFPFFYQNQSLSHDKKGSHWVEKKRKLCD